MDDDRYHRENNKRDKVPIKKTIRRPDTHLAKLTMSSSAINTLNVCICKYLKHLL